MGDMTGGKPLDARMKRELAAYIDVHYGELDDDVYAGLAFAPVAPSAPATPAAPVAPAAPSASTAPAAPAAPSAPAAPPAPQSGMARSSKAPEPTDDDKTLLGAMRGLFSPKKKGRHRDAGKQAAQSYNVEDMREATRLEPSAPESLESPPFGYEASAAMPLASEAPRASEGLASWLEEVDEPFSTTLLALIDRKGLTDVEVYQRAQMSRQLFSRIRSNPSYRPAKKTVLALGIAMALSLVELRDLLERAGFALSHASKRDLIVEYFVTKGIYDLFVINEALYEFDQPLL